MSTQSAALSGKDDQVGNSPAKEGSNTGASVETSSKVAKTFRTQRLFWHIEIGLVTTRTQPEPAPYQHAQQPAQETAAQPVRTFPTGAPKAQALAPEMGVAGALAPAPVTGTAHGISETTKKVYFDMTAGKTDMPPPNPPGPPVNVGLGGIS
ncbi:MAG TPA: hypothetical protein VMW75_16715 [Thermoanaerobaculia bacterium]|nr:hypothetical protein [Thermoanaerobaculia bacterium]